MKKTDIGKYFVCVTVVLCSFFIIPQAHSQGQVLVKVGGSSMNEVVEVAAKVSGRTLTPAMRKAAIEELERGVVKYGDDAVRATRHGGLELVESASKHGDDIWRFSSNVPAASRALAMRPDELLPLTRRIGTEVLELEAKNPGIASHVVAQFGDDAVKHLAQHASPSDLSRLAGYAAKADSPATKALLYDTYKREGTHFLDKLNWKHIIAGGLSASMILGAYEVGAGVREGVNEVGKGTREGLTEVAKNHPETFRDTTVGIVDRFADYMTRPVVWPMIFFGVGLAIILLVKINRRVNRKKVSR